jgi:predicted MFS family arabinose efflux permease
MPGIHSNLVVAWVWILLGFASGFALGSNFHQEQWLGGYASHKRRLYRLAHISFFGLALVNLMFYFTARSFAHETSTVTVASWGFIAGAVTMPVCCLVMAHFPKSRALFLIPVLSLISAGGLTLWEVANL